MNWRTLEPHPAAGSFPLLAGREFEELKGSISGFGFDPEHPIVMFEGQVLDGRNRLRACIETGIEPTLVTRDDVEPWDYAWRHNADRRHLEPGQKAMLWRVHAAASGAWHAEREQAKAEANAARSAKAKEQHATSNPRRGEKSGPGSREPAPEPKRQAEKDAEQVKVSPATMKRAAAVQRDAPDLVAKVCAGELSLSEASAEVKARKKAVLAEQLEAEPVPAPGGTYHVIAIDPPWHYDSRADDATHRGRNQYPDMSTDELCRLTVPAADDCVLWLWTTNTFMPDAYRLLSAWGFTPKTILTWDKEKLGLGDWLRNVTEHCILAVRGRPVVTLTNQTTIIREARREHSRKPEAFYALVESLCPGSKLEMFARAPRDGWTVWGAETGKFVT